jgi:hypothetical protein
MLPLHSAVASAKLISSLSSESDSWALVPQGGFGFPFLSFSPQLYARHLFVYFTGRKWYIYIVLHNVKYISLFSEIIAVDYKDFFFFCNKRTCGNLIQKQLPQGAMIMTNRKHKLFWILSQPCEVVN